MLSTRSIFQLFIRIFFIICAIFLVVCSSSNNKIQEKQELTSEQNECIEELVNKFNKIPTKCVEDPIRFKIQCEYPDRNALREKYKSLVTSKNIQICDLVNLKFYLELEDIGQKACKHPKLAQLAQFLKRDQCECTGGFVQEHNNINLNQDVRHSDAGLGKILDWEKTHKGIRVVCKNRLLFSEKYIPKENKPGVVRIETNQMNDIRQIREYMELAIEE